MKEGRASRTAELVCSGRALAHGRTDVTRFSDPTALALLPPATQARMERLRAGVVPGGLRERMKAGYFDVQSKLMIARTVAIDDAVRAAASPQVVILGAGLDGRAWRMPELHDAVVFEVDHPDSQRDKRERAARLTPCAKDIRFVAVDFVRDSLDDALTRAGHDPSLPTTFIWEGVVMYLTQQQIESTLAVVSRRSASGSRLAVHYHAPAFTLRVIGLYLRRLGEPLRTSLAPSAMRALLERHGFEIVWDETIPALGTALSPELGKALHSLTFQRIVTATRR
ncbi:MAG TPA: class I SAM-dependent methyltransferase [Polyangiaceae bacterium]|nr:class I SAM-dependent methyltransferase [Polyangiaceae bacterium]